MTHFASVNVIMSKRFPPLSHFLLSSTYQWEFSPQRDEERSLSWARNIMRENVFGENQANIPNATISKNPIK